MCAFHAILIELGCEFYGSPGSVDNSNADLPQLGFDELSTAPGRGEVLKNL
jgi:hypothetical protein